MLVKHLQLFNLPLDNIDKSKWGLFIIALFYALYWEQVTPIQYNGDSDSYLSIGRMLLGHIGAIYRTVGYPILLIISGAIIPGTFFYLLLIQAVLAAFIPVIIYQILKPYSCKLAVFVGIIAIISGVTTVHTSQVMTETLFTFLLFLGLYIAIRIVRDNPIQKNLFYWLAIIFAMLNTVRPIAWLIFWSLLIVLSLFIWNKKLLSEVGKSILGSMILFVTLMSTWVLIDDVFFSFGARYSPVFSPKSTQDNFPEIYLYDIPFYEAYYNPWRKRIEALPEITSAYGSLENQPAMKQIRDIILQQVKKDKNNFRNNNHYSYELFGKYADDPQELTKRMFAVPNYAYTIYIKNALETNLPKKTRLTLYNKAAKELGFNWPRRWLNAWYENPFASITGPSHGRSSQEFLLTYTSLRHYIPNPESNNYHSLVNPKNGPANQFLFSTLTQGLRDHPDLWEDSTNVFTSSIANPKLLTRYIIAKPNQQYAWDITRMLWDLMGFHSMSTLLAKASAETIKLYKIPYILRIWDNILMVALGPGYIEFDTLGPQFGKVEIYDYLETLQMSEQERKELQSTKNRYGATYTKLQQPIAWGYFLFYLCKPFLFFTSILTLAIFLIRQISIIIPIILIIPYFISIVVYGTLFTALPRYTDPTLLLPLIITALLVLEYKDMWKKNKNLNFLEVKHDKY